MKSRKSNVELQRDFLFGMLTTLLCIVVLLLVFPSSFCSCRISPQTAIIAAMAPSAPATPAPLSPATGPVGTVVTISGSGFGSDNTIEMNGLIGGNMQDIASPDGQTLTFTVPANLGPNCTPGQACPQFLVLVAPNTYEISVITNNVAQNIGTFTVTGAAQ